jgi:hypothetical protein
MALGLTAVAQQKQINSRLPQGLRVANVDAKHRDVKVPAMKTSELMDNGIPFANVQARTYTSPVANPTGAALRTTTVEEAVIGFSAYDLQTNGTISNRLVKNDDGTISAAWTYSSQNASPWSDRGTGYNYYDPNDPNLWINGWYDPISGNGPGLTSTPARTEGATRTGFTNIVVTSTGKEMSICHWGTGMHLNWRPTKGTGAWTGSTTALAGGSGNTDTWAKATADGDTVHAIWQGSGVSGVAVDGQDGPIYYNRSNDGGATWSVFKQVIPAIDSTFYTGFGGDSYSIDAKNGVVAIAYSGAFKDVGLLKSTDGGNTWTKTIIQTCELPLFNETTTLTPDTDLDGAADPILGNGEDAHVLIDNNGQCHVWFSVMYYMNDDTTDDSYSYYPYTDGLLYWNESMGSDEYELIAQAIDANGNDTLDLPASTCTLDIGYYGGGGISHMPSAGIDANGTLYVSYQSLCEECDTTTFTPGSNQARRHVYIITSNDGGANWTYPYDIVPSLAAGGNGEAEEAVFADLARDVDNNVYVLYMRDTEPGNSLYTAGSCDQINNSSAGASNMVFAKVEAATVGIGGKPKSADFTVSQNYPNPANGMTSINVTLTKASSVVLQVTDIVGKTVYTESFRGFGAGLNTINLNTANFATGVYNYSIITNEAKVTKQMIVR